MNKCKNKKFTKFLNLSIKMQIDWKENFEIKMYDLESSTIIYNKTNYF